MDVPEILVKEGSNQSTPQKRTTSPDIKFADMKLSTPTHLVVGRLSGSKNLKPPQLFMVREKSLEHNSQSISNQNGENSLNPNRQRKLSMRLKVYRPSFTIMRKNSPKGSSLSQMMCK